MTLWFPKKKNYEQETNLNFLFLLNIDGSNGETHLEIKGPVGSEIKKAVGLGPSITKQGKKLGFTKLDIFYPPSYIRSS